MSVLCPDPKVYEAIYHKMCAYTFNKTVDINYCSVFSSVTFEQIQEFVTSLCDLNEQSYNKRYNKQTKAGEELSKFINFRFKNPKINTYQMLKYLQCIQYNIELKHENVLILDKAINEISHRIINELPEYQTAKYSEI